MTQTHTTRTAYVRLESWGSRWTVSCYDDTDTALTPLSDGRHTDWLSASDARPFAQACVRALARAGYAVRYDTMVADVSYMQGREIVHPIVVQASKP
jgi:hypothetical protein